MKLVKRLLKDLNINIEVLKSLLKSEKDAIKLIFIISILYFVLAGLNILPFKFLALIITILSLVLLLDYFLE